MAENSSISWTTHTFNPWRGCTKIAAGCVNCYAAREAVRFPMMRGIWGDSGTRVLAAESMWKEPVKWNRKAECWCGASGLGDHKECKFCESGCERPRVFCASLADVFEDWTGPVSDHNGKWILQCDSCANPKGSLYREAVPPFGLEKYYEHGCGEHCRKLTLGDIRGDLSSLIDKTPNLDWLLLTKRPENIRKMWVTRSGENAESVSVMSYRSNVWLGTSIACREDLVNIAKLRKCRDLVPVLFLSIEPLIEDLGEIDLTGIDWVICGCESGSRRRPMKTSFAESLMDQCAKAAKAFFNKQMEVCGGVTEDVNAFPEHLRVRQFPVSASQAT